MIDSVKRYSSLLFIQAILLLSGRGMAWGEEGRPVLLAPADLARYQPARPTFRWERVDSGLTTIVQIARDDSFLQIALIDTVPPDTPGADTLLVPPRVLRNDSTYFWRVGVCAGGDTCLFSLPRSFTVAPAPEIVPGSLLFGYVRRGDTSEAAVSVRNPLPFPITVDSIRSRTGLFHALTPLPAVVDSLDTLLLGFSPAGFLLTVDSLSVCTTLGEHPLRVTGDSPPPLCVASADSVGFGDVAIGDTATSTLQVRNGGVINALRIGRIAARTRSFRIRPRGPLTVSPEGSAGILIEFVPEAHRGTPAGSYDDTLTIDSDGGRSLVRLRGESPPPRLVAVPEQIDFGEVAIRDSVIRPLRLVNVSVNRLRIDSVRTHRQPFFAWPVRGVLRIQDTLEVPLRFSPTHYGRSRDTLQVFSNAPGSPHRVALRGASPPPLLVTDQRTMIFGAIPAGESGRLILGISNSSLSPLEIDSVTTATRLFRVEKYPVFTHLHRGDTLRLQVTFQPDSAGSFHDTLMIAANAPGSPFRVRLSGVGSAVAGTEENGGFTLFQNFPNPFREVTTFRFSLPERCSVHLVIFNSLGQIIAAPVDGERDAGYHNVVWRGGDAASGMYFYKLIAVAAENPDRQYGASKRLMILR